MLSIRRREQIQSSWTTIRIPVRQSSLDLAPAPPNSNPHCTMLCGLSITDKGLTDSTQPLYEWRIAVPTTLHTARSKLYTSSTVPSAESLGNPARVMCGDTTTLSILLLETVSITCPMLEHRACSWIYHHPHLAN